MAFAGHSVALDPDDILPRIVARRAQSHPDRPFLQMVGGESLTYGQLHTDALIWADAYRNLGVGEGHTVLVMMPTRFEYWQSWLGLGWLGAADVPVNTDYRGRILEHVVANSKASVVLTTTAFVDRLAAAVGEAGQVATVIVVDDDDDPANSGLPFEVVPSRRFLSGATPQPPDRTPQLWDLASVVYTSGTTGLSKGAVLPWGHIVRFQNFAPVSELSEQDAFYAPFSTFHIAAKSIPQLMAQCGGRIVLRERLSPSHFWSDIAAHGCTTTALVGAMLPMISAHPPAPHDAETPLRNVIMAPAIREVDAFRERFGVRVCTAYAMTEVPIPFHSHGFTVTGANYQSCGQLAEGLEVRLVDEHDDAVPPGDVGELIVRPIEPWSMSLGYLGMPESSVAAWRNGWFHTGDAFRIDDAGNYYFVDRRKDCIRRRGENISSFEVEAIVRTHPSVAEVAAIPVSSPLGEDDVMVVIVCAEGSTLDPRTLIEHLIPRMPRFMIPRYVDVVDELPKTEATLRVKKAALRDRGVTGSTWDREAAGVVLPR